MGALGLACFVTVAPERGDVPLVPALLGLGIGAGLFTASSVAAAVRAVPVARSGLASGVNNTARQAGTALGVAVFGAVAGTPADAGAFVAGLHGLAIVGAAVWVTAAVITLATVSRFSASPAPSGSWR